MNHHEIEQQDIIERYVRHQLKPEERRAFQEHYFACDQCFAAVEGTAKFIAGVQRSSRIGALAENAREVASVAVTPWWASFFKPSFVLATTACLLLAVGIGWLIFKPSSSLPDNTAQKGSTEITPQPSPTPQSSPTTNETASPSPKDEKPKREELDNKMARVETPTPRPNLEPKGNVIIDLESSRGAGQKSSAKISEVATLTLRAEVEPNRTIIYQMQILDSGGRVVKTLSGLHASASGALTVSVPAKSFAAGKYAVKLYRLKNQQKEFVGDYDMTLRQ